ncbi:hypothetical protein UFOVP967_66 [uncultured Caudovirales phage]|uniref:Uncharacterized protein n=1 Tax=uncultured Caudovirales phage TaxID=2100421 RepID=A0A6J5SX36_9CAUD|nr:hypothetical protein UFOVP521_50 [uncultured Caudovirales phage]CAB4167349.1 hypothetical protein UFOVP856_22 [uncultured Caudovirales phage]CAB4174609.1 hypothetical protein UFOVP967_66 [uncultured Caudovirales phage]CAB4180286.1 hypothetical protein UFOVP1036_15 [uncultured Caudovirales phage]CAB4186258.1 hypothetical protein UFOVP1132_52 [uncultured Caudovirales phage]
MAFLSSILWVLGVKCKHKYPGNLSKKFGQKEGNLPFSDQIARVRSYFLIGMMVGLRGILLIVGKISWAWLA